MNPDFEMITHSFKGGFDIKVIPISDVHLGSPECMEQEFIEFINNVAKEEHTYLVLGGDLIENGVRNSVGNSVYKQKFPPSVQKREMINILKPVKDKILCMVAGNHEFRSKKDDDDDIMLDIASALGIEHLYRENIAFVKIQLGLDKYSSSKPSNEKRPAYCLIVTHGSGGGGLLTGSSLNRNERFGYVLDGADCLIVGHNHRPYTTQPGKIYVDKQNNKVTIKPFKVISSTSWLNYGGYSAQKMLLPTTFCINTLTLRGSKKEMVVTM